MSDRFAVSKVVLSGSQINPASVNQILLVDHGIVSRSKFLNGCLFSDSRVNVNARDFSLTVNPATLVFLPTNLGRTEFAFRPFQKLIRLLRYDLISSLDLYLTVRVHWSGKDPYWELPFGIDISSVDDRLKGWWEKKNFFTAFRNYCQLCGSTLETLEPSILEFTYKLRFHGDSRGIRPDEILGSLDNLSGFLLTNSVSKFEVQFEPISARLIPSQCFPPASKAKSIGYVMPRAQALFGTQFDLQERLGLDAASTQMKLAADPNEANESGDLEFAWSKRRHHIRKLVRQFSETTNADY